MDFVRTGCIPNEQYHFLIFQTHNSDINWSLSKTKVSEQSLLPFRVQFKSATTSDGDELKLGNSL